MLANGASRTGLGVLLNSLSHDEYIPASLALLKPGGRIAEIGKRGIWSAEEMRQARPDVAYDVIAVDHRTADDPAWMQGTLEACVRHVGSGDVAPLTLTTFELRYEVVEAFQFLQRANQTGNVVINVVLNSY